MDKAETIRRILDPGIVAILRMDTSDTLLHVVEALFEGGITVMEIPMTTPDALQTIAGVKKNFGDKIVMGVGSILDSDTARAAIVIGADFIVTPVTKPELVKTCNRYLKPIICGAYTPTEAFHAHESGADFVKIFPADNLGPSYIKGILAPLPMLRLVPTGGINLDNAAEYMRIGCAGLGIASSLIPAEALQKKDWKRISHIASAFVDAVQTAK